MRVGNRFCGRCGHELRAASRFCSNCGHARPASTGQASAQRGMRDLGAAPQRAQQLPDSAPTLTAGLAAAQPGSAGRRADAFQQGRPPASLAPHGASPPRPVPPARAARRPAYLLPLVAVLAIIVAGGGVIGATLVIRHLHNQPAAQGKLAALSPPSTSAPPATPATPVSPPSSSPPPPPSQVSLNGITIDIGSVNTDPDATAVATTLATYFGGIDAGNYTQAWDTYSASLQQSVPYQPFANGLSTSQDIQVVVQSIQDDADGIIEADVSFQSHQAGQYGPNQGETCTNWSLDYYLVPAADSSGSLSYLINKVTDIGPGHVSC